MHLRRRILVLMLRSISLSWANHSKGSTILTVPSGPTDPAESIAGHCAKCGGGCRTEFGDMQLLDVAVLPWPRRETGLLIGVGPTFVFPTATSRSAGQGAWQAGPALAPVYKGIPWRVAGVVFQDPISFAYSSPNRPPQNTLELQPILTIHLRPGWYLRSADATWVCGLHHRSATVLPFSLGI